VAEPLERLVGFGRALRAAGLPVGTGRIESFCRAAALVEAADLYWAGRATLVAGPDGIELYDRVFRASFEDQPVPPQPRARNVAVPNAGLGAELATGSDAETPAPALASTVELLRQKSFARCSQDDLEQLAELMSRMRVEPPLRHLRRRRPSRNGSLDLRRTIRRSFRTGGEPVERARRDRRRVPRRVVLLLDVSGSMSDYSRGLLMFAHAALRSNARWEAFCFGTRLTKLTGALAARDPDEALRRAADHVVDWNAGTRIGESLARLLSRHANTVRGAVVVVCSDGLDVGDPELLAEQMARLSRLSHSVVWLNPLQESPRYQPLARGMRAALPYVDVFAAGHNLASLAALGR
jgi:uncharacterized protein with von Willebrand factor type A (vWA) domain